jgi:hypothetical protein
VTQSWLGLGVLRIPVCLTIRAIIGDVKKSAVSKPPKLI